MIFGKKKKMPDTKAKPPADTPPKSGTIERGATMWITKGNNLMESSMYAEAIQCYDKALEINPRIEKIWSNKGLAIAKMNEKKEKIDLQKIAATLPKEVKPVPKNSDIIKGKKWQLKIL
jgi:tetratricopeptide (TPR) repeat protein